MMSRRDVLRNGADGWRERLSRGLGSDEGGGL
jgi:hypothetical protein